MTQIREPICPTVRTKEIAEIIQRNGGLYCLGWYVAWTPCEKKVTLDDEFTADQLRDIADHMDKITKEREGGATADGNLGAIF